MVDDFYDKTVDLLSESEGYTDDYGLYHEGAETVIETISCDVQPYSAELLKKEYGHTDEVTKRIFCDTNSNIAIGKLIEYQTKRYIIQRIIEWDDYIEVMVKNYE